MDNFHSSLSNALLQLFRNRYFTPLYPFKTIIQSLLRDETLGDKGSLPLMQTDYLSIPEEKLHLFVKMMSFGDSGFAGSKHIAKMLSAASIKELRTIADVVRGMITAGIPSQIRTTQIEADFIEVYSPQCGFSHNLSRPMPHYIAMTLEVVIKGPTFDDCINLFIRRILEESHVAVNSHSIFVNHIKVVSRQFSEEINAYTMRERRQQVLNTLKAAVLNAGEICLDMVVHTKIALHSYGKMTSNGYLDHTDGMVRVKRRYKLSFRDGSNHTRCFSLNPLESIALGMFTSLKDADFYLSVYSEHLRRMKLNEAVYGRVKEDVNVPGVKSTLMLNELISAICCRIYKKWDSGNLLDAGIQMLLFLCVVGSKGKTLTYAMKQIKLVTGGRAGHVRAIRSAVEALKKAVLLFLRDLRASAVVTKKLRGVALSLEERQELEVLYDLYQSFCPSVKQIRQIVLDFVQTEQYSEVQYLCPYLLSLVWKLFDPINKTQPLVHPEISRLESRGLAGVENTLVVCEQVLHKLCNALMMVELTLATELYLLMAKADLFSYRNYRKQTILGGHKLLSARSREDMPRCLIDTLGYAFSRTTWLKGKVHIVEYNSFTWMPLPISDSLRHQLFSDRTDVQLSGFKRSAKLDRMILQSNLEEEITKVDQLWDFYTILGEYNIRRLGAIDFECAAEEEALQYQVPYFMTLEGVKIRYLRETRILQALHEAYFDAATAPQKLSRFPILSNNLFKYCTYLPLWKGVSKSLLEDFVFYPSRRNRILPAVSNRSEKKSDDGYYRIELSGLPENVKDAVNGGIIGPDRVLNALGPYTDDIFRIAWHIPAILPSAPLPRRGMQIKLFCGLSTATAVEWGRPRLHRLQQIQRNLDDSLDLVALQSYLNITPVCKGPESIERKRKLLERLFGRTNKDLNAQTTRGSGVDEGDYSIEHEDIDRLAAEVSVALRKKIRYGSSADSSGADSGDSDVEDQQTKTYNDDLFIENFGVNALGESAGPRGSSDFSENARKLPSIAAVFEHKKNEETKKEHVSTSDNNNDGHDNNPPRDSTECGIHYDLDQGKLDYLGRIDLEMVMTINYESEDMLDQVRSCFGAEVSRCCRHMLEQSDWRLTRVVVHREPETSGEIGTKKEHLASIFNALDLEVDISSRGNGNGSGNGMFQQMENIAAKSGTAMIECGMLFPEHSSQVSVKRFKNIIVQLATKPENGHQTTKATPMNTTLRTSASEYSDGFDPVGPSLIAAKKNNVIKYNLANSTIAEEALNVPSRVEEEDEEEEDGDLEDVCHVDLQFLNDLDESGCIDPIGNDIERICGTAALSQILKQNIPSPSIVGESAVRCYVPCRIRWTLLAQLKPRVDAVWKNTGNPLKFGFSKNISDAGIAGGLKNKKASKFSAVLGYRSSAISIGSDDNISRLVAGTVWFSKEAGSAIWGYANGAIANCIYYEAKQRQLAFGRCMDEGHICSAYGNAMLVALLTQNYNLVLHIYRAFNSIAFKFHRFTHCVDLCHKLLAGNSTQCDIAAVVQTISRYICLSSRYLLTSPQAAHLRGGTSFLLKSITTLESLLCIAPIPYNCATGNLPDVIKAASSEVNKYNENDNAEQHKPAVHSFQKQHGIANLPNENGHNKFEAALRLPTNTRFENNSKDGTLDNSRDQTLESNNENSRVVQIEEGSYATNVKSSSFKAEKTFTALSSYESVNQKAEPFNKNQSKAVGSYDIDNGSVSMSKALARSNNREQVISLLWDIEGMAQTLLYAFAKDMHACFPEINNDSFKLKGGFSSLKSSDTSVSHQELTRDDLHMYNAGEVMDLVLGSEASLPAIAAYAHRSDCEVNHLLSDPSFSHNVQQAHTFQKMREVKNAVINTVYAVERLTTLQKIADSSRSCSVRDQRTLRRLVLPVVKKFTSRAIEPTVIDEHNAVSSCSEVELNASIVTEQAIPFNKNDENGEAANENGLQSVVKEQIKGGKVLTRRPSVLLEGRANPKLAKLVDQLHGVAEIHEDENAAETNHADDGENKAIEADNSNIDTIPESVSSIINKIFGASKLNTSSELDCQLSVQASSDKHSVESHTSLSSKDSNEMNESNFRLKRLAGNYEPKIILSRFHDEALTAKQETQRLKDAVNEADLAIPVDDSQQYPPQQQMDHIERFSVSGFQLHGKSVQEAAKTNSMLHLLRSYGGVPSNSIQRSAALGTEATPPAVIASSPTKMFTQNSVLDNLRRLPKPDYQSANSSFF